MVAKPTTPSPAAQPAWVIQKSPIPTTPTATKTLATPNSRAVAAPCSLDCQGLGNARLLRMERSNHGIFAEPFVRLVNYSDYPKEEAGAAPATANTVPGVGRARR